MNNAYRRVAERCWSLACQLALFVLAACAPAEVLAQGVDMTMAGGNNQSAPAFSELPAALSVSFSGSSYVLVDWEVKSGDAYFYETGSTSDSSYQTVSQGTPNSVHLILGSTPGPIVVTVTCLGCGANSETLTFNETSTQPPPALEMDISGGNQQSGPVNTTLPQKLAVVLKLDPNQYDGPAVEPITFQVISGSAKFGENNSTTYTQNVRVYMPPPSVSRGGGSSTGRAAIAKALDTFGVNATLVLGPTAGPITVRVTCPDCKLGQARIFYETSTAVSTSSLEKVSGDAQSGTVGTAAAAPLVVQLPGSTGQTISWTVTSGSATLSSAQTTTDSNGLSSITFKYGATPGPIVIQASAGSAGSVTFSETAVAASQGTATVISGNNQTGMTGAPLQPFVLQLGNSTGGAAGVTVTWSIVQGGGTLASSTTTTDSSGHTSNTLTLGPSAGTVIVQATAPGYGTTTFTANATATLPGSTILTIVSGNNQALIPNTTSQPLVVKLTTSDGTAIPGTSLQWAVSGSSGTLGSTTTTTDASGQSQNTVKIILPAQYTVTVQVANQPQVAPVTFTFNNAVANLPTLSGPQMGVANAIDKACPALAAASNLTAPQRDFLARCSEVVVGSGTVPEQVPGALNAMLNNKAEPQSGLADSVMMGQLNNLNVRLAELRQGSQGFSVGGLTLNEDGRSLAASSLGDIFTSYLKDPKESTDSEVGKDFDRWGFFATGLVDRGGASADGVSPGFNFHNASITAGVDYRFNDSFVAGLALGYASNNSDLDANAGKVNVDSYSLNAYFTWYHNNDFYVEGSLVADWLNYDLSRNVAYQIASLDGGTTSVNQTANASPNGNQYSASLSIGRDFNSGAWTFSPYVRGIYSHVSLDGFSETMSDPNGAGSGLGTSVQSRSFTSELGVIGGRVSRTISMDWGVLVPNALIEWNHDFKNDPQTVVTRFLADPTQTPIILTDPSADQNYFNIGIGLNAVLPQGRSGFIYYEHVAGYSGIHENRLSIGVRVEF